MRSRPTSDRDGCLHGGLNEREAAPVRASAQRHLRTKSGRNQAPQYVVTAELAYAQDYCEPPGRGERPRAAGPGRP